MFYCPSCGGKVIFDVPSQQMKCVYCGNTTPPEQYDVNNEVKESTYETNVYVCRNCGAELTSPDEQMMSFCSYCGSEAMLAGRVQAENRPNEIIPFRISKKQCQNIYRDKIKKCLFVPKELKNEQFLEQFRGIYIPYWSIKVDFPQMAQQTVYTETPMGGSRYMHNTYLVTAQAYHNQSRYLRDGSSSLDDTISDAIGDFSEKTKPFVPSYLAGFYADRADVPPQRYVDDVQQEAQEDAGKALSQEYSRRTMRPTSVSSLTFQRQGIDRNQLNLAASANKAFQPVCQDFYGKLLPVWFLTWRNKDRVSYVVMNGETGSMYTELPVQKSKYLLLTGIIAVVLFALLSIFLTTVAPTTMGICSLVAAYSLLLFSGEIRDLMEKERHVNDLGAKDYDPSTFKQRRRDRSKKTGIGLMIFLGIAAYVIFYFFGDLFEGNQYSVMNFCVLAATVIAVINLISSLRYGFKLNEKGLVLWAILNALAVFTCSAIAVIKPVQDWWYYVGAAICMGGSFIPALKLIDILNLMATRPLPSFFGREGANHGIND